MIQNDTTPTQSLTQHLNYHCACVHLCVFNHSYYFCFSDVSIDILDELDLTHLRATGLQPNEEELPEGEQAAPAAGKLSVFIVLLPQGFFFRSWILDSLSLKLGLMDSGFQSFVGFRNHLAEFRIWKPRIPDFPGLCNPDSPSWGDWGGGGGGGVRWLKKNCGI